MNTSPVPGYDQRQEGDVSDHEHSGGGDQVGNGHRVSAQPGRSKLTFSAVAFAVLLGTLVGLHVLHLLKGHAWFSNHGVLVAAAWTAILVMATGPRPYGKTAWRAAGALVLTVVPEWFEGELAAGHALTWPTISDDGATLMMTLAAVVVLGILGEARRVVHLVRR